MNRPELLGSRPIDESMVVDEIETLILLAMDGKHTAWGKEFISAKSGSGSSGMELCMTPLDKHIKFSTQKPCSSYTFELSSDDRLISGNKDYLIRLPQDILGDGKEFCALHDHHLRWMYAKKIHNLPRMVMPCIFGRKMSAIYEVHFRRIWLDGTGDYMRDILIFDNNGNYIPYKIGNLYRDTEEHYFATVLCCSAIEDAHRANTMLCSVKDAIELKFPVPIDAYKEIFALRDAPLNDAKTRRKAIIHWVAKHLRQSSKGKQSEVKKHIRGVEEIVIDGITIKLEPNDK
jgi:hypothetical protein